MGSLTTTTGALRTTKPSVTPNHSGFVAKLNATGSGLQYSTYLGGTSSDDIKGLAVDNSGDAYLVGATTSVDFPVSNAYQGTSKGGKDAFVTKLNPGGSALIFSTYVGGSADDSANAVAVDAAGNVYVAGDTFSTDFPRLGGRAKGHNDTVANNAFITEFAPTGNTLIASTYFGGAACLTPTVPSCTPTQPNDGATAIAVDPTGSYVYVAGYLSSVIVALTDPIQGALNGPTDAFVAKLAMPFFLYATRIGGSDIDLANGIALDGSGNAYVVGTSNGGTNFPTTLGAAKIATGAGSDAFVAKIATPGVRLKVLLQGSPNTYQMTGLLDPSVNGGTVTFFDGGTALAQEPVVGGIATFTTTLMVGIHKITAAYSGNGLSSDTVIFVISQQ